jgi:uncharacterized membrane protein
VPLAAAALILAGLALATTGLLAHRQRLPRNRFVGVRTPATLRDEQTFRAANRVAALPILTGGLIGILAGVLALTPTTARLTVLLLGLIGMLAITAAGGVLAHRTAQALPEPKRPLPPGCDGCACGNCPVMATKP